MTQHDPERPEIAVEGEDDVEAHGLKEAAVAGMSAAALIAGAGNAMAANAPETKAPAAKQAVDKTHSTFKLAGDPTYKLDATSKLPAAAATVKIDTKAAAVIKYDLKSNHEG